MRFIGDVHCEFREYTRIASEADKSIQVGDFGLGFRPYASELDSEKHKFIRGNHDNPELCRVHPQYLGDFGVYQDIFFLSGADSADKVMRIEGLSWWRDEELSMFQLYEAMELYSKTKPEIVVSHECPDEARFLICPTCQNGTRTSQVLQTMFENHQPKLWIFGHHHKSWNQKIDKTRFICLKSLEYFDI